MEDREVFGEVRRGDVCDSECGEMGKLLLE